MCFRDRLTFDATSGVYHDGAARYMMIKSETLMGILHHMPADRRAGVLGAMAASVEENGGRSAATYRAAGAEGPDALLSVIASTAPELGWGIWTFLRTDDGFDLTVANNPFAAGFGPSDTPVCSPILGMLRAVASMILGGQPSVAEQGCTAQGADVCRFSVFRERSVG